MTKVNGTGVNGARQSARVATAPGNHRFGRLSHRLVTLLELQLKLFRADAKDSLHDLIRPAILLVGGAVLGLSSVTVLLITCVCAFHQWGGLSWTGACFTTTLISFLVTGAALFVGWKFMQKGLVVFRRSQDELRTNVAWLVDLLRHGASDEIQL